MKTKANLMLFKNENQEDSRLDWLKWTISVILLLAVLVGNHYYSEISVLIRSVACLAVLVLAGFVAATTKRGKWVVAFFRDSRAELRKVVWPTREETVQMTLIVMGMVIVLALVLWGMDGILVWLIGWLTGQRGGQA